MATRIATRAILSMVTIIVLSAGISCAGPNMTKQQENRNIKKITAPLDVTCKVPSEVVIGATVRLNVLFTPRQTVKNLTVWFTTSKGIATTNNEKILLGSFTKDQNTEKIVEVTTHENGLSYLNVFHEGVYNGKYISGVNSIPLQVGNDSTNMQKPGKVIIDNSGQKLMDMKGGLQ